MTERPPAIFMPYPLDEYLDALPGDYGKVARRLLRAARWTPGDVEGIALDAGEALMDERSERLGGELRLDRDVSSEGRRALIRRVLERLERDGWASRRAARACGPAIGPESGPRSGPSPTVVRFLKYRAILWPASATSAQETAQNSARETARARGPIPPEYPPEPPCPPEKLSPSPAAPAPRRRGRAGGEPDPRHRPLQERLEAAFLDVRRATYGFQGGRDAKGVAELLRLSGGDGGEVERRWRRALELGAKYPGCATIALLAARWNEFAPLGANGERRGAPFPAMTAAAFTGDGSGGFGT